MAPAGLLVLLLAGLVAFVYGAYAAVAAYVTSRCLNPDLGALALAALYVVAVVGVLALAVWWR